MKCFWGKPIGGFRGIVRNLRTVFSFRESEIGPSFIWGLFMRACVVEKILQTSKSTRA